MSKRIKLLTTAIMLGLLCTTALVGCNKKQVSVEENWGYESIHKVTDDTVTFRLIEGISESELLEMNGKNVEFVSYMSIDHSITDNDYMIATFHPEGVCAYHQEDLSTMINVPVKLPEGFSSYTYSPLKIKGKIKVGEVKDKAGHTFKVTIEDATIEEVKEENTEGILKTYVGLANKGVFADLRKEYVNIDKAFGYKIFNLGLDELQKINIDKLEEIKSMVVEVNKDGSLDDLIKSIEKSLIVGEYVNDALNKGDLNLFNSSEEMIQNTIEMFDVYKNWQLKYSV